jgi:hypothetical protein
MKPIIFFVSLLVSSLSFSAFAQKNSSAETPAKIIQFKEVFTTVSIEDDLEVVLTDGNSDNIAVDGNVKATMSEGQLFLSAKNPRMAAGNKVLIPANFLSRVYMNGNGSLSSESVLRNKKVKIYLASEAKINVRSLGNVAVETVDGIQFVKGR